MHADASHGDPPPLIAEATADLIVIAGTLQLAPPNRTARCSSWQHHG